MEKNLEGKKYENTIDFLIAMYVKKIYHEKLIIEKHQKKIDIFETEICKLQDEKIIRQEIEKT